MVETSQASHAHDDACASSFLRLELQQIRPLFSRARVIIPKNIVNLFFEHACFDQKIITQASGFHKGNVPLEYIQQNYTSSLVEHIKELLFKYLVYDFLHNALFKQKVLYAGEPRLTDIHLEPNEDAIYYFDLSLSQSIPLQEWKYFVFKAPKRKKYKDLDRQVESFMKEERDACKKFEDNGIQVNDWIRLELSLLDHEDGPLLDDHTTSLWLKMGDEDADSLLCKLFCGKRAGDSFVTQNKGFQDFFGKHFETHYPMHITITDVLPYHYFCMDLFKKHFRLKTNKEVFQKLIEVFSYRNNLSQRRTMVEESLYLLLHKHKFEVPNHLVLRQQQRVLDAIKENPDFHVYRAQKDFDTRVRQLAEKQVKECILIDQIAFNENLSVSQQDIKSYLSLTNRPRTKEFIYFDPPVTKIRGQETPIPEALLHTICMREKTLNYIIHHLTKK